MSVVCCFLKELYFFFRTNYLCKAKLNDDQRKALIVPAKKAYGDDLSKWDDVVVGKLCSLMKALPVEDVLKLSGEVVRKRLENRPSSSDPSFLFISLLFHSSIIGLYTHLLVGVDSKASLHSYFIVLLKRELHSAWHIILHFRIDCIGLGLGV